MDAQLEWPLEENVPTFLVEHEAPLAFSRQSHVEHVSTLHAPEELRRTVGTLPSSRVDVSIRVIVHFVGMGLSDLQSTIQFDISSLLPLRLGHFLFNQIYIVKILDQ